MAEIIHDGFGWARSSARGAWIPKWDDGLPNFNTSGSGNSLLGGRGAHNLEDTFSSAGGYWIEKNFPAARSRIFIGQALHVGAITATLAIVNPIGSVFDGSTAQVTLTTETDWSIGLRLGDKAGSLIAKTAANTLSHGLAWEWFEFELVINNTTGVWRIWKEGSLLAAFTGLNTRSTSNNSGTKYRLGANGGQGGYWVNTTDFYLIDDQAGNGPTNRVGDSSMYGLFPDGAGSSTDFTPSAGSNWQNVHDRPSDEDGTYNGASVVGNKDRYTFSNLPGGFNGTTISVTHGYRLRKDDAGARTARGAIRSGSSEVADTTQTLTTSYQSFAHTIWADPATSTLFTALGTGATAVVNALQAGPEIIA